VGTASSGALTTGMDRGEHPAKLKRLGRHKSFDVLGEYLEFEDLLKGIRSTACSNPAPPLPSPPHRQSYPLGCGR
jgi:hypothetical protein